MCGCASAVLDRDSPACCVPGWLCCARFLSGPSLGSAASASSAEPASVSEHYGAPLAKRNKAGHVHYKNLLLLFYHKK